MDQKRYAFVIRVWNESLTKKTEHPKEIELRGSLHVTSPDAGEVYYFDSFDKVSEILKQITGWETDSPPLQSVSKVPGT